MTVFFYLLCSCMARGLWRAISMVVIVSSMLSVGVYAQNSSVSQIDPGGGGAGPKPCSQLTTEERKADAEGDCRCGVHLQTNLPLIGNCLRKDQTFLKIAFPLLMEQLVEIVVSLIFIVAVIVTIIGAIRMIAGGYDSAQFSSGKKMIIAVFVGLIALGLSGYILRLVNPNFFGPRDELYEEEGSTNVVPPQVRQQSPGGGGSVNHIQPN